MGTNNIWIRQDEIAIRLIRSLISKYKQVSWEDHKSYPHGSNVDGRRGAGRWGGKAGIRFISMKENDKRMKFSVPSVFSKTYYLAIWKRFIKFSCPSLLPCVLRRPGCVFITCKGQCLKNVCCVIAPWALALHCVWPDQPFFKRDLVTDLSDFNHEVIFLILNTSVNTIWKGFFNLLEMLWGLM